MPEGGVCEVGVKGVEGTKEDTTGDGANGTRGRDEEIVIAIRFAILIVLALLVLFVLSHLLIMIEMAACDG